MARFALLIAIALAGCRWGFGLLRDDATSVDPDAGFVLDDAGQLVSCAVDTDCGRCQRCDNMFCQRARFGELGLGQHNGCALDERGDVWCWGTNSYLNVASELSGLDIIPRPRRRTEPEVSAIQHIAVGWGLTYMLDGNGALISRGTTDGNVNDNQHVWGKLFATHFTGCALSGGELYCSGLDDSGQRGTGATFGNAAQPLAKFGADADWQTASPGNATCAIKTNGTLWCVGQNNFGQLGRGSITTNETSIAQVGAATDWLAVDVGDLHACALKTNGTLWCWGRDLASDTATTAPVQVGTATDWSQLDVYNRCTAALRGGSTLYMQCRDATEVASVIAGTQSFDWMPVALAIDPNTRPVLGAESACLRQNGAWVCWGDNTVGAVGVDTLAVVGPTPLCE